MTQVPSIPKGTRDYGPDVMVKRDYIFNAIRTVFRRHGFLPLETPAMEQLSTLTGKYGEEGEKLLFKVLNSGDFLSRVSDEELAGRDAGRLAARLCEKGLRYDLTVPLARFVVQHKEELTFPFKRYQIQPVWRADRPQRGRYREFYQCDADVVGSTSLLNEAELVEVIDEVFERLDIRVVVLVNNRKVLAGIAEVIGCGGMLTGIMVAVDKLEKVGIEGVRLELLERGVPAVAVEKLLPILQLEGENEEVMDRLEGMLAGSETGVEGMEETRRVLEYARVTGVKARVKFDLTLARGLSYYTGTILEVKAAGTEMGSIAGGGRYDDLTGVFGLKNMPGVGISFGADRIYDVMTRQDLFPAETGEMPRFLFVNFGEREVRYCLPLLRALREGGHNAELYPEAARVGKQVGYADRKGIPFVVLVGEEEMRMGTVVVKRMSTGEQRVLPTGELMDI